MHIDDLHIDAPATGEAPDDEADGQYQAGFDAASDGRRWIRSALSVLTADIAIGVELCDAESRAARVEAARMIARILKAIAPDPLA